MKNKVKVTIIGAGIIDVLASGIKLNDNFIETKNLDEIKLSFGGDALNESVLLSKLGVNVELITVVGDDESGKQIIDFLKNNNVSVDKVIIEPGLRSSINIVLVDNNGERYFLSDSNSSLRKLKKNHILNQLENSGKFVCLASLFVSPLLKIKDLAEIFEILKNENKFIIADMTRPKFGEKVKDLKPILKYIDVLIGNLEEFTTLTESDNTAEIIKYFNDLGSKCLIIKNGDRGSILNFNRKTYKIPAYKTNKVIDTTGAGDSYAAGLIWGLLNKYSLIDSCLFASALSSCIVEQLGATSGFTSIDIVNNRFELLKKSYKKLED